MENLVLLLILILLFSGFITSSLFLYKQEQEKKYSFLKMFPYELRTKNNTLNILPMIFLILSIGLTSYFSLALLYFERENLICRSFSLSLLINGIFLVGVFVLDMSDYKVHIIQTSLLYVMTFVNYVLFSYWVFRDGQNTYPLWVGIVCIIISFIILLSMFCKPLINWYKLKKNEKGDEFSRGKVFILAFIEWCIIFLYFALFILLVIGRM